MMFASKEIVTGLDIGTSQVTAIVAEVGPSDMPNIIGIGQAKSRGVRKGEIVDADSATEDVRLALTEAEHMADEEVRSVYLGVSGGHVQGFINRGIHPVVSAERDITEEDVRDVVRNAKAVNLPNDHHVIHLVRQHFSIDGQSGIQNPIGLLGAKIEVDLHVIHGQVNRLQNSIRVVKNLRVDVEDVVFSGLAGVLAVLSSQQKELGTLVLDFGGGTIEYAVCCNGLIKHTGVLPVGGDHISNDLAYGFKVPLGEAEQLKINYGSALGGDSFRGQTIKVPDRMGMPDKTINMEHFGRIMSLRVSESLKLVEAKLMEAGCLDLVRSGVVISGGGARITDILGLAEHVFGVPASVGVVRNVNGPKIVLEQPEFAVGIGLTKFGVFELLKQRDRKANGPRFGCAIRQLLKIARTSG
ncbi:MAG: Cell division protein FtsA [Verrucomicrobia subdivision 3 bacterium]|nr:Cell division protein FtsA [Limisphaerales bacterium]MCS1412391.1 Cell division protein FtsA [Limisphaerales bacterium]